MLRKRKNKAQSTLEYILVFTAIVGAIILATATIKTNVTDTLEDAANDMKAKATAIDFSKFFGDNDLEEEVVVDPEPEPD